MNLGKLETKALQECINDNVKYMLLQQAVEHHASMIIIKLMKDNWQIVVYLKLDVLKLYIRDCLTAKQDRPLITR
jgi:hypothetical protein